MEAPKAGILTCLEGSLTGHENFVVILSPQLGYYWYLFKEP
jgi:hypothetical protein